MPRIQVTLDIEPEQTLAQAMFAHVKGLMSPAELVEQCLQSEDPWAAIADALNAVNERYNKAHANSRVMFTFKRGEEPTYVIETF